MAFTHSLFSVCPTIQLKDVEIVAQTSWKLKILSLGLLNRTVKIDPEAKTVRIHDRIFWLFLRRRKYRFESIRAIAYGYSDWGMNFLSLAHDSFDVFEVGIKLHNDSNDYRRLFTFIGDGQFVNDSIWPDWMYWEEYLTDFRGTQESESKQFVEVLHQLTKASIEPR